MNDFFRIKSKTFVTIANNFLKDRELSNKSKGVLAMILAFPDDWDFSVKGMVAVIKDGESALRSAINELRDFRYCIRIRERNNGKISRWKYYFSGEKITKELLCDFLQVENLQVENQTELNNIFNNKEVNNKEKKEDDKSSKKKSFIKPTIEEIDAYIKEHDYKFKAEEFYDHYESNGWMVGKTKMVDWKAACRTWQRMRKSKKEEEKKEETADNLPKGMTQEQWTKIALFLSSNVVLIAAKITPKMLARMKELAGEKSSICMAILKKINDMAEYDNDIDVMQTYERLIKEFWEGK